MDQSFLVCDVHGVHLNIWILVVIKMHIIGGPDEKLLLLLHAHILLTCSLVLLLNLHVPVFVFAV